MNITEIREAFALTLGPLDVQVYAHVPDGPDVPCLIIYPRPFDYDMVFEGAGHELLFVIWCLTGMVDEESAQRKLDLWLSDEGAQSVKRLIEADSELGGVVSSATVSRLDSYGTIQLTDGGTRYLSAELLVEVLT